MRGDGRLFIQGAKVSPGGHGHIAQMGTGLVLTRSIVDFQLKGYLDGGDFTDRG